MVVEVIMNSQLLQLWLSLNQTAPTLQAMPVPAATLTHWVLTSTCFIPNKINYLAVKTSPLFFLYIKHMQNASFHESWHAKISSFRVYRSMCQCGFLRCQNFYVVRYIYIYIYSWIDSNAGGLLSKLQMCGGEMVRTLHCMPYFTHTF